MPTNASGPESLARSTGPIKTARGFTLIEMLVVLAIIALLAAVAMPQFARMPNDDSAAQPQKVASKLLALRTAAMSQAQVKSFEPSSAPAMVFAPAVGSAGSLIFYPDGSSNGGQLELPGPKYIDVRWADGRIDVRDD